MEVSLTPQTKSLIRSDAHRLAVRGEPVSNRAVHVAIETDATAAALDAGLRHLTDTEDGINNEYENPYSGLRIKWNRGSPSSSVLRFSNVAMAGYGKY